MRIAIIGYGKMGKMVEEVALQRGHEVTVKINIENTEDFTKENISKADVAIEFTGPDSAFEDVTKCIGFGIPVVSGSTGWNDKLSEAKKICAETNGSFLHTSNFSVGVNIFFEINKHLARLMASQPDYSVSLKEIHHTQKKDAPSGTAVSLAEQIIQNNSVKKKWVNHDTFVADEIPVLSERTDPAPGTHYIKYSSDIDDIEIIHTAHSRKGFALGAVLAAEYIADKKGVFTMADVLKL